MFNSAVALVTRGIGICLCAYYNKNNHIARKYWITTLIIGLLLGCVAEIGMIIAAYDNRSEYIREFKIWLIAMFFCELIIEGTVFIYYLWKTTICRKK